MISGGDAQHSAIPDFHSYQCSNHFSPTYEYWLSRTTSTSNPFPEHTDYPDEENETDFTSASDESVSEPEYHSSHRLIIFVEKVTDDLKHFMKAEEESCCNICEVKYVTSAEPGSNSDVPAVTKMEDLCGSSSMICDWPCSGRWNPSLGLGPLEELFNYLDTSCLANSYQLRPSTCFYRNQELRTSTCFYQTPEEFLLDQSTRTTNASYTTCPREPQSRTHHREYDSGETAIEYGETKFALNYQNV